MKTGALEPDSPARNGPGYRRRGEVRYDAIHHDTMVRKGTVRAATTICFMLANKKISRRNGKVLSRIYVNAISLIVVFLLLGLRVLLTWAFGC
jgi:predicted transcriptional regulator